MHESAEPRPRSGGTDGNALDRELRAEAAHDEEFACPVEKIARDGRPRSPLDAGGIVGSRAPDIHGLVGLEIRVGDDSCRVSIPLGTEEPLALLPPEERLAGGRVREPHQRSASRSTLRIAELEKAHEPRRGLVCRARLEAAPGRTDLAWTSCNLARRRGLRRGDDDRRSGAATQGQKHSENEENTHTQETPTLRSPIQTQRVRYWQGLTRAAAPSVPPFAAMSRELPRTRGHSRVRARSR